MTDEIFVTGDRSVAPATAVMAVMGALGPLVVDGKMPRLVTGDSKTGIENAVRFLFPDVRVVEADLLPTGKPDFDSRNALASVSCDRALVIHGSPLDSTIYRSAVKYWDDDALTVWP